MDVRDFRSIGWRRRSCGAVPLSGQPFGTNDDPDKVFAIYDKAPGSRVIYQWASIAS